jgi:nucleotide-binding universal stress UspA family protein
MLPINPVRSILAPIDFSEESLHSMNYAAAIAYTIKSRLLLCHISPIPVVISAAPSNTDISGQIVDDLIVNLKKITSGLLTLFPGLKVDHSIASGMIRENILEIVSANNIDLIIMGTHGSGGWREVVFGTNTASLVKSSPVPVIAVPYGKREFKLNRIAFATTFADYDLQTLFQLSELFKPYSPEITVLHIEDKNVGQELNKLRDDFAKHVKSGITYEKISFKVIENKNIEKAINDYISRDDIDLLVVSTRRQNVFERFTDKSLSQKLTFHSKIPLMVYQAENKTSYPFF